MTTPKMNDVDAIDIKRDAQRKIYEIIKEMTPEQEISHFQQSVNKSRFADWWKSTSSRAELSETR